MGTAGAEHAMFFAKVGGRRGGGVGFRQEGRVAGGGNSRSRACYVL